MMQRKLSRFILPKVRDFVPTGVEALFSPIDMFYPRIVSLLLPLSACGERF
jgi:hypothetical protein